MKDITQHHTATMTIKTQGRGRCSGVMEKAIQQKLTKALEDLDADLTIMDDEMEYLELVSISDIEIEVT